MGATLKTELKKAFNNKLFVTAVVISSLIAIAAAVVASLSYLQTANRFGEGNNPWLPVGTVYRYWIGDDGGSVMPYVFYTLLPLTASFAYGWSYSYELKSGYIKNVLIRTTKTRYFISKYIATFLSGFAVAAMPLVLNILLVGCFVPAVKPDVFYNFSYLHYSGLMFSDLFFKHPILYIAAMIFLASVFAGLYAVMSLALSMLIKNRIAVTTVPFLLLLMFNYLTGMYMDVFNEVGELSPLKFLHVTTGNLVYLHIALIEIIVLFIITFSLTVVRGVKKDVF